MQDNNNNNNYKTAKEAFISDQNGSTITHINLISSVALASVALHSVLRSRFPQSASFNLITEFILLVFPLLLSMTAFAKKPLILTSVLLIPAFLLVRFPFRTQEPTPSTRPCQTASSPQTLNHKDSKTNEPVHPGILVVPIPALTTYRTHMLIMTFLAILAVDFPVFPRTLAKCETFGVSLMDMGVGSFVFSQGVVSSIPLLKDPSHLSAPLLPKLAKVARKTMPLILLGLLRVILVKGTEYPEHESEYGTHWNFFITMATLPLLEVLLHPIILYIPIEVVGAIITLVHQLALSTTGLQDWTLSAARLDIISQNKEGLVSLPGYLAIHLLGVVTGTVLLPPSPSDFRILKHYIRNGRTGITPSVIRPEPRPRQDTVILKWLGLYAVLWWASRNLLAIALDILGLGSGVSRRLANTHYVLWVTAYNTTFIAAYLAIDLYFFHPTPKQEFSRTSPALFSPLSNSSSSPPDTSIPCTHAPRKAAMLLEAINVNGLPLFLLANLATGLVNVTVQTMYTADIQAMGILSLYAFGISGVAWVTRERRLWKL